MRKRVKSPTAGHDRQCHRGVDPGHGRQPQHLRPAQRDLPRSVSIVAGFRRTVKWRTGSEARISTLKRQYGWDRTRLDNLEGARIRTGHGVLIHNLPRSRQ